ncbi:MAG TPA: Ig-like domain-containing protein [Candidatus Krumholzibacteria bacterium]|nr:Ig-like domain-containing protein [Candidatus Krumholzibacteria bacterium]
MKTTLLKFAMVLTLLLAGAMSAQGLIPNDDDGDGVPNATDLCPAENSSGFDRNGDGCLDPFRGARHIEYWSTTDNNLTYVINATAAPNITNGTDITAIQNAIAAWPAIAGTGLTVTYGGTTAQTNANGLDHVNMVTFLDNSWSFGNLVLAVGLTTSFESDTTIAARVYRKGEIFDADMIFNPSVTFKVGGVGPGVDIQSVATHEAGHMFGLSHSAVQSSTMFYALPGGLAARSLTTDDQLVYFKAYGSAAALSTAKDIHGTVHNGSTNQPAPGAIVFLINAASGDTTGCDFTLPDGTYTFPGIANGNYYVAIHALDATSAIGFIQPGNINALVAATAFTNFKPEWYDAAESATDDPNARTQISVSNGQPVATADLITNVDATPPVVLLARPDGSAAIAVDGAIVIEFSEPIDINTIRSSFSLRDLGTNAGKGGNIALIKDDTQIVFTPSPPLDFSKSYRLRFDTDLKDHAGNPLASDYTVDFNTQNEPPVSISSLAPNKGTFGTTVVITGRGFDVSPPPVVKFGSVFAIVQNATVGRLVVEVPNSAETGPVTVTNADLTVSNALTFTVLTAAEFARGYESGQTTFAAVPNAIALTASGDYAYIAADDGAHAVVVNPALPGYLSQTTIPYASSLDDIATTANGRRAYAISSASHELVEINSDPTTGILFNTVLSSHNLGTAPKGIITDPAGQRVYIAMDDGHIQSWDIELGSVNYTQQVGQMSAPAASGFVGPMTLSPDGFSLLALTDAGSVAFYDLPAETLFTDVVVGAGAMGITVDATGQRAYVTHDDGDITVLNVEGAPFKVQDIATGGSVKSIVSTPGASYLYTTDRELDNLKIIDLKETSPTFRNVVGVIPAPANPVDVALSAGGEYAFSVLQGGGGSVPRMLVTTIGIGPALESVAPLHASQNAMVVLSGLSFGDPLAGEIASVNFNGVIAPAISQLQNRVVVRVPAGATSGPVRVRTTINGQIQESNALSFEVFASNSFPHLRESVLISDTGGDHINEIMAMRPQGDVEFIGTNEGRILAYDTRPGSPTFHQRIGRFLATADATSDLAVSADGRALFVTAAGSASTKAKVLNANPNSPTFGEEIRLFTLDTGDNTNLRLVEASPDNRYVALYDRTSQVLGLFDATGVVDETTMLQIQSLTGHYQCMKWHPSGLELYLGESTVNRVEILNTDPNSPQFGLIVGFENITGPVPTETPTSLGVTPDGFNLYALTQQTQGPVARSILHWPVDPLTGADTGAPTRTTFAPGGALRLEKLAISPRGDTAVRTQHGDNLHYMSLATLADINTSGSALALTNAGVEFDPTGSRIYYTDTVGNGLRVFELNNVAVVYKYSGDAQNGVTGQVLPAPLRVNLFDQLEFGFGVPGVSLNFAVTQGGGMLRVGDQLVTSAIIATDTQGFAQVDWQLGSAGQPQEVTVTGTGILGSPVTFTATASADPESLPLSLSEVLPLSGTSANSTSTAIVATFSRGIDPATITSASFFIQVEADATKVPVTYGFTDGNRKVSMTPTKPLNYTTQYRVLYTAGIKTPTSNALTNPSSALWQTGAAPPLALQAISPPSALVGVNVTLSGAGFDPNPAANTVNFAGGVTATPVSGNTTELVVKVPANAIPGNVTVTRSAVTSNAVNFTVLVPIVSPIDEVIATIGTGSGVKSCTVSPDGSLCYTVSPDGDVVIPVDIAGATTYAAINVGDQPVAIVMRPDGKVAYVANFNSGTVSVIDTDKNSSTFNTVLTTINVGSNPTDLAVYPDGDRVVVANAGSGDISVIDTDSSSVAYHSVIATVGQGTGAKSVTVSPDGTLLFILTTSGTILVVDVHPGSTSENQVIATVGAGNGAKGLTVSPDGTLLFVLLEGSDNVLVIAISVIPGVGVANSNAAATSFTFHSSVVDEIVLDSSPAFVAVDPSGSGKIFVPTPGNKSLVVINSAGTIPAQVRVRPRTLNLQTDGGWVIGEITLPLPHLTADIVKSTIRLQGTVPVILNFGLLLDLDHDGIQTLYVAFNRALFQATLPQGEYVPVTITGQTSGGRVFAGVDTVRTLRPVITNPHGGDHLMPNHPVTVTWTTPHGYEQFIDRADVHFSGDDGVTWTRLAHKIPNTGSFNWVTPNANLPLCRIMVTLYWKHGDNATFGTDEDDGHEDEHGDAIFGMGMSQDPFAITAPVAVALKSADAKVVDGDAVLTWETNFEDGVRGFQVVRAEAEDGVFTTVTKELIASHGAVAGSSYEFHDASIRPNRTYWYKLVEVTSDGDGTAFGPYAVSFKVTNALEQNVPNPFNPATTIKYSIAQDTDVSLVVYDVSGQRVRTLVDDHQRADVYKIAWDGVNDRGQRVASGMYFYKLVAGKFVQTRKMVLLK